MNNRLSLTLIVKNEENHLPNVLRYAHMFADEIIIIDTGSTDNTIEVARKFTEKVYTFKWQDDFAKARNYGISKCTGDFIMWLDADDIISEEDANKIKNLMKKSIDWDVCYIPYKVGTYLIKRERIFRNNDIIKFVNPIHECLKFDEFKHKSDIDDIHIIHNKIHVNENSNERNLRILLKSVKKKEYRRDPRMWSLLGGEYLYKGDIDSSILSYQNAIKFDNNNYYNYYGLALAYKGKNQTDLALESLWKAVGKNPLIRETYFELGKTYFELGKFNEALFVFLSLLNITSDTERYIIEKDKYDNGYVYDWISVIYGNKQDYKNAIKFVNKALNIDKNSERLINNKSYWKNLIDKNK